MLKWSRTTPQPTRRLTLDRVSGEGQFQGQDWVREVTPDPSPKPNVTTMDLEIQNGVGSPTETTTTTTTSKFVKRPASNLTRTDSGKSSKSVRSVMTLSAFDPETAGTLARDTEVTYSIDTIDPTDTTGTTGTSSAADTLGFSEDISSSTPSLSAFRGQGKSSKQDGGGSSSNYTTKTTTTTTTETSSGSTSHNGDIHINGDIGIQSSTSSASSSPSKGTNEILSTQPAIGKQIKTSKTTTTTKTSVTKKGISSSESKITDASPDTQEENESIISTLDNLLVDLDNQDKSFDETMVTASLDRKSQMQKPRNPPKKKLGSFSIRSAFDESPLEKKTASNTSLHDNTFKGELSSKLLNGHQEKVNLSDPDLNSKPDTYSINRQTTHTTTKTYSSSRRFGSGQDITNTFDKNLETGKKDKSNGGGASVVNGAASGEEISPNSNGHDLNVIEHEVMTENSKTSVVGTGSGKSVVGVSSGATTQSHGASPSSSAAVSERSAARQQAVETFFAGSGQQTSEAEKSVSRPTSRATERSAARSSIVRSDSGRSPTPPNFKVRDIRGSLSRPSSALSGTGDRSSGGFGSYSPNRSSLNSSPTREAIPVTSTGVGTTSSGKVKRGDGGASERSSAWVEGASSTRASGISTGSSAGPVAGEYSLLRDKNRTSSTSQITSQITSERTSVVSTISNSSDTVTGSSQLESPTRAAGFPVSRTSSSAGGSSRPASAASGKKSADILSKRSTVELVEGQTASQISKVESKGQGHVSRSEIGRSKAEGQVSRSGSKRSSAVEVRPAGQPSTSESISSRSNSQKSKLAGQGQTSRSDSQRSKSSSGKSSRQSSASSYTSYNFLDEKDKKRKSSKGSDTDDKVFDDVDTTDVGGEKGQVNEITQVEKVPSVYTSGEILRSERAAKDERAEELPAKASSTSSSGKPEISSKLKNETDDVYDKLILPKQSSLLYDPENQKSTVGAKKESKEQKSNAAIAKDGVSSESKVKTDQQPTGYENVILPKSSSLLHDPENQQSGAENIQKTEPDVLAATPKRSVERREKRNKSDTYDTVFTTNDRENPPDYSTQSSYGSLSSVEGDKSFRKSASNLLEDFKSGRLTSAESTLEKKPPKGKGGGVGEAGEIHSSSSSIVSSSATETKLSSRSQNRPDNINIMGVKSLDRAGATTARGAGGGSMSSAGGGGSASGSEQALNGENVPTSPIAKEAQNTVTRGLVTKLSKDIFANLNLTGRSIDPSAVRAKSPEPEPTTNGEQSEKKFKFLIEGIDTPAAEEEAVSPEVAAGERSELSPGIDSLERKPKGFSYIKMDSGLAGEIQKRAETMSSKKPHEAIEVKKASSERIDESHYESLELKEAKAKLHRQIIQSHKQQDPATNEGESGALSLREARAKLNKQIADRRRESSRDSIVEGEEGVGRGDSAEEARVTFRNNNSGKAPSKHVGGSGSRGPSSQSLLHAELHQQIRERGKRKQSEEAAVTAAEVGTTGSRAEPTSSNREVVTPVARESGGRQPSSPVTLTGTVEEDRGTIGTTSAVPPPPQPPPLPTIASSPALVSHTSPDGKQHTAATERSEVSGTNSRGTTIRIEDIGEDISEDYANNNRVKNNRDLNQPREIQEEFISPSYNKRNNKPTSHRQPVEIEEDLIAPTFKTRNNKPTARVIEVDEPFISASSSDRNSSSRNREYPIEAVPNEVSEENIKRQAGLPQQKPRGREIDDAFDQLERIGKQKQAVNNEQLLLPRVSTSLPRASTSAASSAGVNNNNTTTRTAAVKQVDRRDRPRTASSRTASEGVLIDQLSPDSAYQSAAASPIFVTAQPVKDLTRSQQQLQPARNVIMVQRGAGDLQAFPAPSGGGGMGSQLQQQPQQQQYESRKMMMMNTKLSSHSSKQTVNGETVQQAESRELSERQMQYEHSGRPNEDGVMISSSRNESSAYRGTGPPDPVRVDLTAAGTGTGPGPSGNNTIHHPIQMNGDLTGAQYPSVDSGRIMNSAQPDLYADVRGAQQHNHQHPALTAHGGYSATSSSEGINVNAPNRYNNHIHQHQDDPHYQQPQYHSSGVTRKASHLSSSSAGSAAGQPRIVQLRPLTVDVNMANRGGPAAGVFSPSVKHSQAMYEIQNMTGGSYAPPQYNGYSPGQLNGNVEYTHYNTTGRIYRNTTGPPRKYMKVRDMNSNDMGYRDLEGQQYRRSRRHPYVARVNLEGDPYYSDFEGGSVHSEPMTTRLQRRISSRSRQRTLPSAGGPRHWSSSQPSGLHQVPLGDPVHLNIHPQQGHGYGSSSSQSPDGIGRLYKARSEGMLIDPNMYGGGVGGGGGGTGEVLSPTLTDAHQTRRGDYHITLKLNNLGRGMLDSASTGSYDQGWGTLGDEASNTWNYKSAASWQRDSRDPKASVSLVDIELNDSGVHEPPPPVAVPAPRQPTTVTLHAEPRDREDGSPQHWFRAYHQHHEAAHHPPASAPAPPTVVSEPEISTNIPKYNTNPPSSPSQKDTAFAMQVNQTMRMDYKPKEHEEPKTPEEGVPKVVRGTILIKNTIDTTGGARVIDVVETETDGENEPLLDDNTNLFHPEYRQGKENPMYASNEDLSNLASKRPAFTSIFQQDETDYIDIPINREPRSRRPPPREEERMGRSEGRSEGHEEQLDMTRLLRNAPAGSVKQTINVEREEEEILGPLTINDAEGEMSDPDGLLNFDTISEKVDLGVLDGKAQLAVKVRCERVVPIRGVEDMFKKSSVIVTRLIQIDMEATEERQRLYRRIMRGSSQQMIEGPDSRQRYARGGVRKLDTKDTFNLYKAFMGVAEAHEGNERENVKIERRIEDQKQLPEQAEFEFDMTGDNVMTNGYADGYDDMDFDDGDFDTEELERRLERKMRPVGESGMRLEEMPGGRGQYLMKNPEPDTISYISQASEHSDLLY